MTTFLHVLKVIVIVIAALFALTFTVYIFNLDAAVEGTFGVNDNNGAGFAQTEATRTDYLNFFVQTVLGDLLFKALDQLIGTAGSTAGTAADEHVCTIKIHVCSSLTFAYGYSAAPMVYS